MIIAKVVLMDSNYVVFLILENNKCFRTIENCPEMDN
jgi:hypothetical protein